MWITNVLTRVFLIATCLTTYGLVSLFYLCILLFDSFTDTTDRTSTRSTRRSPFRPDFWSGLKRIIVVLYSIIVIILQIVRSKQAYSNVYWIIFSGPIHVFDDKVFFSLSLSFLVFFTVFYVVFPRTTTPINLRTVQSTTDDEPNGPLEWIIVLLSFGLLSFDPGIVYLPFFCVSVPFFFFSYSSSSPHLRRPLYRVLYVYTTLLVFTEWIIFTILPFLSLDTINRTFVRWGILPYSFFSSTSSSSTLSNVLYLGILYLCLLTLQQVLSLVVRNTVPSPTAITVSPTASSYAPLDETILEHSIETLPSVPSSPSSSPLSFVSNGCRSVYRAWYPSMLYLVKESIFVYHFLYPFVLSRSVYILPSIISLVCLVRYMYIGTSHRYHRLSSKMDRFCLRSCCFLYILQGIGTLTLSIFVQIRFTDYFNPLSSSFTLYPFSLPSVRETIPFPVRIIGWLPETLSIQFFVFIFIGLLTYPLYKTVTYRLLRSLPENPSSPPDSSPALATVSYLYLVSRIAIHLVRGYFVWTILLILYVLGLYHVNIFYTGYIIFFALFSASSSLRQRYWNSLILYAGLLLVILYIFRILAIYTPSLVPSLPLWVVPYDLRNPQYSLLQTSYTGTIILLFTTILQSTFIYRSYSPNAYAIEMERLYHTYPPLRSLIHRLRSFELSFGLWFIYGILFTLFLYMLINVMNIVNLSILFFIVYRHSHWGITSARNVPYFAVPVTKIYVLSKLVQYFRTFALWQSICLVLRYVYQFPIISFSFNTWWNDTLRWNTIVTVNQLGLEYYIDPVTYTGNVFLGLLPNSCCLFLCVWIIRILDTSLHIQRIIPSVRIHASAPTTTNITGGVPSPSNDEPNRVHRLLSPMLTKLSPFILTVTGVILGITVTQMGSLWVSLSITVGTLVLLLVLLTYHVQYTNDNERIQPGLHASVASSTVSWYSRVSNIGWLIIHGTNYWVTYLLYYYSPWLLFLLSGGLIVTYDSNVIGYALFLSIVSLTCYVHRLPYFLPSSLGSSNSFLSSSLTDIVRVYFSLPRLSSYPRSWWLVLYGSSILIMMVKYLYQFEYFSFRYHRWYTGGSRDAEYWGMYRLDHISTDPPTTVRSFHGHEVWLLLFPYPVILLLALLQRFIQEWEPYLDTVHESWIPLFSSTASVENHFCLQHAVRYTVDLIVSIEMEKSILRSIDSAYDMYDVLLDDLCTHVPEIMNDTILRNQYITPLYRIRSLPRDHPANQVYIGIVYKILQWQRQTTFTAGLTKFSWRYADSLHQCTLLFFLLCSSGTALDIWSVVTIVLLIVWLTGQGSDNTVHRFPLLSVFRYLVNIFGILSIIVRGIFGYLGFPPFTGITWSDYLDPSFQRFFGLTLPSPQRSFSIIFPFLLLILNQSLSRSVDPVEKEKEFLLPFRLLYEYCTDVSVSAQTITAVQRTMDHDHDDTGAVASASLLAQPVLPSIFVQQLPHSHYVNTWDTLVYILCRYGYMIIGTVLFLLSTLRTGVYGLVQLYGSLLSLYMVGMYSYHDYTNHMKKTITMINHAHYYCLFVFFFTLLYQLPWVPTPSFVHCPFTLDTRQCFHYSTMIGLTKLDDQIASSSFPLFGWSDGIYLYSLFYGILLLYHYLIRTTLYLHIWNQGQSDKLLAVYRLNEAIDELHRQKRLAIENETNERKQLQARIERLMHHVLVWERTATSVISSTVASAETTVQARVPLSASVPYAEDYVPEAPINVYAEERSTDESMSNAGESTSQAVYAPSPRSRRTVRKYVRIRWETDFTIPPTVSPVYVLVMVNEIGTTLFGDWRILQRNVIPLRNYIDIPRYEKGQYPPRTKAFASATQPFLVPGALYEFKIAYETKYVTGKFSLPSNRLRLDPRSLLPSTDASVSPVDDASDSLPSLAAEAGRNERPDASFISDDVIRGNRDRYFCCGCERGCGGWLRWCMLKTELFFAARINPILYPSLKTFIRVLPNENFTVPLEYTYVYGSLRLAFRRGQQFYGFVRLLGFSVLSHSQLWIGIVSMIEILVYGNVWMVPFLLVYFLYVTIEFPLPSFRLWTYLLYYLFLMMLIKIMFQLPLFCMYRNSKDYWVPSLWFVCTTSDETGTDNGATVTNVIPEDHYFQPSIVFGIYKVSSVYHGHGLFLSLLTEFTLVMLILYHRHALRKQGLWEDPQRVVHRRRRDDGERESNTLASTATTIDHQYRSLPPSEEESVPSSYEQPLLVPTVEDTSFDHRDPSFDAVSTPTPRPSLSFAYRTPSVPPTEVTNGTSLFPPPQPFLSLSFPPLLSHPSTDLSLTSPSSLWIPNLPRRNDSFYRFIPTFLYSFWLRITHPSLACPLKSGHDYYFPTFLVQFVLLLQTILTYGVFSTPENETVSVQESLAYNQFSGEMITVVILLLGIMIMERICYLLRWATGKWVLHLVTVLGIHIFIFLILPIQTDRSLYSNILLGLWYIVWYVYFSLSSKQLYTGYPSTIPQDTILSGRYGYNPPIPFLYNLYLSIPFLSELRSILDWITTRTSLDIFMWLKLESIHRNLFLVQCNYIGKQRNIDTIKGRKVQTSWYKCSCGITLFGVLLFIILLPALLFSNLNPVLQTNNVQDAGGRILFRTPRSGTLELWTNAYAQSIRALSMNEFEQLRNNVTDNPSIPSPIRPDWYPLTQEIMLPSVASTVWSIAPDVVTRVRDDLGECMNGSRWETFVFRVELVYRFRRKGPKDHENIENTEGYTLNPRDCYAWYRLWDSIGTVGSTGTVTIPSLYPSVLRLPATAAMVPLGSLRRDMELVLRNRNHSLWWYSTFTEREKDIEKVNLQIIIPPTETNHDDGPLFYTISDRIAPSLLLSGILGISSYSVLAVYFTLVLGIGKLVRNLFTTSLTVYDNLEDVTLLLELCEGIPYVRSTSRFTSNYVDEAHLYGLLVTVLRLPNVLYHISRKRKID